MSATRPLTVVSGALGSGKTTLLRRLLAAGALPRTALLVNELGEVGLDAAQLADAPFRRLDERTVLLPGGCVCCSRREDVTEALLDLLDAEAGGRSPRVDRVVLETTGVADPAPVVATLLAHPVLRHQLAVDRVVVTVDAAAVSRRPQQGPEWVQQVVCADVLAVTKADLAGAEAAAGVAERLRRLNPAARVVPAAEVELVGRPVGPAAWVRPAGPAARPAATVPALGEAHLAGVSSAVLRWSEPVDWAALAVWLAALLHAHGDRVLRVKGLLDTGPLEEAGASGSGADGRGAARGPLVLDGVQHVVHPPRHLDRWEGPRGSDLVVITRDLPAGEVTAALADFLAR